MAILENNLIIEQLEPSSGFTEYEEFVYAYNKSIYVPTGIEYHKIITKTKRLVYQTGNRPQQHSQELIRVKNISAFEGYLEAKSHNAQRSKYFKNTMVKPKKEDYKKGFFIRHFMQLASDDKAPVIEVRKSSYEQADGLYAKVKIKWSLNKDEIKQEELNIHNIMEAEKTFPQIRMKIYNFVEFGKES